MEEALESAAKKTVNVFQILTAGGCSYTNQKTCKYIYLLFSGKKTVRNGKGWKKNLLGMEKGDFYETRHKKILCLHLLTHECFLG